MSGASIERILSLVLLFGACVVPALAEDPSAAPQLSPSRSSPTGGGLRATPDKAQVADMFRPGFDPVPELIDALPSYSDILEKYGDTARFYGLEYDYINGQLLFSERLNKGQSADQIVQAGKNDDETAFHGCTFKTVSQETVAGIRFDRISFECASPGQEPTYGQDIIATDADRNQTISITGSSEWGIEAQRRVEAIYAAYTKSYR